MLIALSVVICKVIKGLLLTMEDATIAALILTGCHEAYTESMLLQLALSIIVFHPSSRSSADTDD